MTPERWRQITGIFHAALSRQADERAAFVAANCGDDALLRNEVESMLAAHDAAGEFGEVPVFAAARELDAESSIARAALSAVHPSGPTGSCPCSALEGWVRCIAPRTPDCIATSR